MNNKPVSKKPSNSMPTYYMFGMLIGMAVGTAIGLAMDNLAIGVGIGAGMGVSLGVAFQERKRQDMAEDVRPTGPIIVAVLVGLLGLVLLGTVLIWLILR